MGLCSCRLLQKCVLVVEACGASADHLKIIDLVITDDAVVPVESQEVLLMSFGGLLVDTVQYLYASGEDVVTKSFAYPGAIVHSDDGPY